MQKKVVLFIVVAVAALAAISIVQSRKAARLKTQAAAGQEKAQADTKALETQQQTIEQLEKQKDQLDKQLREMAGRQQQSTLAPRTNSLAASSPNAEAAEESLGGKEGFLAKMMKDPEMKKMMAQQQKQMLDMMYGPLFKELKLSPEETAKLSALMLTNQMNSVEKGTALFAGGDKAELQKTMADDKAQFELQVKELLGDERFAQYEEFNKALPDRMALTQLKSQFGDNPLSEDQSTQLLQVMKEERERASVDQKAIRPDDYSSMLSEEAMNKFFAQQEEINARVIGRAGSVLTPEQVEVLGRSLTNNIAMQRTGMTMARTMLGGEKKSETEAEPAK